MANHSDSQSIGLGKLSNLNGALLAVVNGYDFRITSVRHELASHFGQAGENDSERGWSNLAPSLYFPNGDLDIINNVNEWLTKPHLIRIGKNGYNRHNIFGIWMK